MKLSIQKRYHFDSAHYLPNYDGKCGFLHGHTYSVDVKISGGQGMDGLLLDFHTLNDIMKPILEIVDHNALNTMIEKPTAENIGRWFFEKIDTAIEEGQYDIDKSIKLESVVVFEGLGGCAIVERDDNE
jgi:6-pyruvoyltetrahydropterin/6-carboxytetrahydropterin synthase